MHASLEVTNGIDMKKWLGFVLTFLVVIQSYAAEDKALPSLLPSTSKSTEAAPVEQSFLDKYPHLKQNLYQEPNSNLYLGFSVGLLGVLKDRMFFAANFFQVHYITSFWDYEVLSVSYGTTTANPSFVQSNHFIFRTIPKYRITDHISVGPLLGWEFVSFPQVKAVLYDGTYQTKSEPFSSSGLIAGIAASQNMTTDAGTKIKVNELIYKETYSTKDAGRGWSYLYDNQDLRSDTTPIDAGIMFLVEVGMMF